MRFTKSVPTAGLLTGAIVWGLIWYPFRALEQAGLSGELAATLTYVGAFGIGALLFRAQLRRARASWLLVAIGLSAGWANIGFTLGVVYGDVMRVVLLFYLAPIWTVIFARLLLDERLSAPGYGLMMVACAGAAVMLWQPGMGWPLPRSPAEWIGGTAGVAFALSNVLARVAGALAIELKVMAVFAGGIAIGAICAAVTAAHAMQWPASAGELILVLVLAIVILSVNVAVQYGLAHVTANRAIVIYLFELIVTAVSAWLLAGETLNAREWCGGAMIVFAGLYSGRMVQAQQAPAQRA